MNLLKGLISGTRLVLLLNKDLSMTLARMTNLLRMSDSSEARTLGEHLPLVSMLIRRNIFGHKLSDDELQEAAMDALRAIRAFQPELGKITTLIGKYVVNGIRNRYKARRMVCRRDHYENTIHSTDMMNGLAGNEVCVLGM